MARLPYLEADQVAPEYRDMLKRNTNLHKLLVNSPDMARAFNLQNPPTPAIAIAEPPGRPLLGSEEIMVLSSGGFLLLLPFAIVLARRLWVRGGRREVLDPENSPRLQRIEQTVEAIALEVERIGEAQRFTTKLLAERQPDAVARIPATRREPGTITPH